MSMHLVVLDGEADDLDVGSIFIPLLADAAGLAHELADDFVHDFDALAIVFPLPVSIAVFGVAFTRMPSALLHALTFGIIAARCPLLEDEDVLV